MLHPPTPPPGRCSPWLAFSKNPPRSVQPEPPSPLILPLSDFLSTHPTPRRGCKFLLGHAVLLVEPNLSPSVQNLIAVVPVLVIMAPHPQRSFSYHALTSITEVFVFLLFLIPPDKLNLKLWEWDPAFCVSISPFRCPGASASSNIKPVSLSGFLERWGWKGAPCSRSCLPLWQSPCRHVSVCHT